MLGGMYVLVVVNGKVLDMNRVEVNGELISLDAFTKLDKSTILTFDASDYTSLALLDLPAATYVNASGCTSLASLDIPAGTYGDVRGCTGLPADVLAHLKVQYGENLMLDMPDDGILVVSFHGRP